MSVSGKPARAAQSRRIAVKPWSPESVRLRGDVGSEPVASAAEFSVKRSRVVHAEIGSRPWFHRHHGSLRADSPDGRLAFDPRGIIKARLASPCAQPTTASEGTLSAGAQTPPMTSTCSAAPRSLSVTASSSKGATAGLPVARRSRGHPGRKPRESRTLKTLPAKEENARRTGGERGYPKIKFREPLSAGMIRERLNRTQLETYSPQARYP